MAEHVVVHGDTLWGIARQHGIRYWPNIYFATENNEFRESHPNPDLIYPGDRVEIPPATAIEPMERHPMLVHRRIPLFTQSAETCWRATGKMLYMRRHQTATAEASFDAAIGQEYRTMETGLASSRWMDFYGTRLGMQEARIQSPGELHALIARHGPVIVAIGDGPSAHSMVMAGYDLYQGRWFVLDPAAGESMTFEPLEITAGAGAASSTVTSPARLTDFHTGPATWENMGRWLWIMDTTVHAQVYYYE